ncbi:hypothetical protein ACKI1J_38440 [Streptomyces scabiei]|uniref:hypothetical protein n=1 Tax=Streptomyces scabiei TaxID=1930 RepID=UPI0038F9FAEF
MASVRLGRLCVRRPETGRPKSHLAIRRRLGSPPHERGSHSGHTCPDIFELEDGRFAVIGSVTTGEIEGIDPGPGKTVVIVDRHTLLRARNDIPDA